MAFVVKKEMPESGVILSASYAKVINITGDKNGLNFTVIYYNSQNDRRENKDWVVSDYFTSFVPDTSDAAIRWDKQIYRYLKSTDQFKNAVDVLEADQTA